jgi:hypothetical protein
MMKLYYAMALLMQIISSTLEQDKQQRAYLLYRWSSLMNESRTDPQEADQWPPVSYPDYPAGATNHHSILDNLP